ncbi:MAG TPA: hypothetical protein VIO11_06615 [Candidatus Methanoperedens sp.]
MSISAVVSSASASSAISSISMSSVTGLAVGGAIATVLLIVLLSSHEIISASSYWDKKVSRMFNAMTLPLLFVFVAIVLWKITEIL